MQSDIALEVFFDCLATFNVLVVLYDVHYIIMELSTVSKIMLVICGPHSSVNKA